MFDFNRISMRPRLSVFKPAATEDQIAELEQHCKHSVPENYKFILKNFNGGSPAAKHFNFMYESTGVLLEGIVGKFYTLDENKELPGNIWWVIEQYSDFLGPDTLPFADDGINQIYYFKWVNNIPEVWFLAYLDLDEPETYKVMPSFDDFLEGLYSED